ARPPAFARTATAAVPRRSRASCVPHQPAPDELAQGPVHDLREQRLFGRKIVINEALADAGFGGDVADAGRAQALGGKNGASGGKDRLATGIFEELVRGGGARHLDDSI